MRSRRELETVTQFPLFYTDTNIINISTDCKIYEVIHQCGYQLQVIRLNKFI